MLIVNHLLPGAIFHAATRFTSLSPDVALRRRPETSQALIQVSILFLEVVCATTLSQRLDPDAIGDVTVGALSRGTAIVVALS